MQDEFPGVAAVSRAVHAALGVVFRGVSECSDIDRVGVVGMHEDLADVAGLLEPDVGPGRAAVAAAVDAVAVADIDPDGRLARAGIDDVGVGFSYRQRAD